MKIKVTLPILLLSVAGIFCSGKPKDIPSLRDICFERCKDDLTEKDVDITIIKNVFQSLQSNNHREEMFALLKAKQHPHVMKEITDYTDYYRKNHFDPKGLNAVNNDLLNIWCKKTAFGMHYTNLAKNLPIQIEGEWQKTSFKVNRDGNLFVLTMPICGPDNYSSVHQFAAAKKTSVYHLEDLKTRTLVTRKYNVKQELYREQKDVYLNEPFYNTGNDTDGHPKNKWLNNHELTNCLDTFPNNNLVITHTWGGIEVHNGTAIEQFMIGNSISSVSCSSNNKHIALGSYDGTVTIVDITQEERHIPETKAHFAKYSDNEQDNEKYPLIVKSCKLSNSPISDIHYCPDGETVLFSAEKSLYSMQVIDTIKYTKPSCLFTDNSHITHCAQINNLIACVSEQNTITLIDVKHKQQNLSVTNQSPITSICPYITEDNSYLVTGDKKGNVIIWNINQTDLTVNMILQHAHPVHLVEVTKDNKHIVIKTTEEVPYQYGTGKYKKDNILLYPTPNTLQECVQKQQQHICCIKEQLSAHYNDPKKLYMLLSDNKEVLYLNKNENISALKDEIEGRIIEYLKSDDFFVTIGSIRQFYDLLISFPSTDPTKPTELKLYGMNAPEKLNLLKNIDQKIKNILIDTVLVKYFTNELENKNVRYQDKENIYRITNKFFWYHFSNRSATPPSTDLKVLIDKLMPMHDLVNPKDNATSWKARLTYFITNNRYSLMGATAIGIPLGYLAYKYFADKK